MPRTLKAIAKEINDNPALGLRAEVSQSWSSTDTHIAGTRFRRQGAGRKGLKIVVCLLRNGQPVCDVDTSQTYRSASEVEEWLADWKLFWRKYKGAATKHFGQVFVEGELQSSRGRLMTVGQLKKLSDDALIWVRLKEHGEDYNRIDDVHHFVRNGSVPSETSYIIDGMSFDLADPGIPKRDDEKLSWDDGDNMISVCHVRLTKFKYKKAGKS